MGGLAVLLLIGLYITGVVWMVRAQESKRAKLIALVVALLIPTVDAILGRIYLQHLCDTEGGLQVNRVVEGVEGFMYKKFTDGDGYWVKKHGYKFTEYAPVNGKVVRYSNQNGQIVREAGVDSISKYQFRSSFVSGVIGRIEDNTETIDGGEVLASYKSFVFQGGWAERFLSRFSDAGGPDNVARCDNNLAHIGIYKSEQVVSSSLKK